jgi:hypothetical protein
MSSFLRLSILTKCQSRELNQILFHVMAQEKTSKSRVLETKENIEE